MRYLAVAIFMLLPCLVNAQGPASCSDSIEITSGSFIFSASDTCYYMTSDLTDAAATAWRTNIGTHNIRINMNGHTLFFGDRPAGTNDVGMVFKSNAYNITIHDGAIYHAGDDIADSCDCMFWEGGNDNIVIENVDFFIRGTNGHCMNYSSGDIIECDITSCNFVSTVHSFTSAGTNDGHAIRFLDLGRALSGSYTIEMSLCSLWAPAGFTCGGKILFHDNYFQIDAHNDYYNYPSGSSNEGTKNCTGIGGAFTGGTWIYDNYICAGSTYTGMQTAILSQASEGTTGDTVIIEGNTIHAQKGEDDYYGYELWVSALKMRYRNYWVVVRDNEIHAYLGDLTKSYLGNKACGITYLTGAANCYWLPNCDKPDSNIWIYNNTITMHAEGTDIDNDGIRGIFIASAFNMNTTSYTWEGANINWYGNHITSPGWCYNIGGDDGTAAGVLIDRDTCVLEAQIGTVQQGTVGLAGSYGSGDTGMYNYLRDMTYTGSFINEYDVTVYNQPDPYQLGLQRTLDIVVVESGIPKANVEVWITNDGNGDTLWDTTNASGHAYPIVTYYEWYAQTSNPPDSNFNDFHFACIVNSDTLEDSMTIAWNDYTDTLTGTAPTWTISLKNTDNTVNSGPIDDACIYDYGSHKDNNYGAYKYMYMGITWDATESAHYGYSAVIRIDSIADYVPAGMVITEALLDLKRRNTAITEGQLLVARRLLKPWNEGDKAAKAATAGEVCGEYWSYDTAYWDADTNTIGHVLRFTCMGGIDDNDNDCAGGFVDCGADDDCYDADSTIIDSVSLYAAIFDYQLDITDEVQNAYTNDSSVSLLLSAYAPAGTGTPAACFYTSNERKTVVFPSCIITYMEEGGGPTDTTGSWRGTYIKGGYLK